eukprot:SM000153S01621  [mRNA]  locus=s153:313320:316329:- [translate_table: standard]
MGGCLASARSRQVKVGSDHWDDDMSLLPGLPDELAVLCLARVPFVYQQRLRGVSKSWRKTISEELGLVRRAEGLQESLLCVCLNKTGAGTLEVKAFAPAHDAWLDLPALQLPAGWADLSSFQAPDLLLSAQVSSQDYISSVAECHLTYAARTVFHLEAQRHGFLMSAAKAGPSLHDGRHHFASAVLKDKLIVAGGLHMGAIDSTEGLVEGGAEWEVLAEMPSSRRSLGAIAMGTHLFTINDTQDTRLGRRAASDVYDSVLNKWETRSKFWPKACGADFDQLAAITAGGSLYAVGGSEHVKGHAGALLRRDNSSGDWTHVAPVPKLEDGDGRCGRAWSGREFLTVQGTYLANIQNRLLVCQRGLYEKYQIKSWSIKEQHIVNLIHIFVHNVHNVEAATLFPQSTADDSPSSLSEGGWVASCVHIKCKSSGAALAGCAVVCV